jgi:hypothetical protein
MFRLVAFIGNDERGADQGVTFPIHVVACNRRTAGAYTTYIDGAESTGAWIGITSLCGGHIAATVVVIRDDQLR